jgi:hypothetical protein
MNSMPGNTASYELQAAQNQSLHCRFLEMSV